MAPIDLVLVIDVSGSMCWAYPNNCLMPQTQATAKSIVNQLDLDYARVGVVGFNTAATIRYGTNQVSALTSSY
jgi:hypothetical protein